MSLFFSYSVFESCRIFALYTAIMEMVLCSDPMSLVPMSVRWLTTTDQVFALQARLTISPPRLFACQLNLVQKPFENYSMTPKQVYLLLLLLLLHSNGSLFFFTLFVFLFCLINLIPKTWLQYGFVGACLLANQRKKYHIIPNVTLRGMNLKPSGTLTLSLKP